MRELTRRVMRVREAAAYVCLAKSTMDKMRLRGDGPPFVKLGRHVVGYCVEDLDSWLASRRTTSTSTTTSMDTTSTPRPSSVA